MHFPINFFKNVCARGLGFCAKLSKFEEKKLQEQKNYWQVEPVNFANQIKNPCSLISRLIINYEITEKKGEQTKQ